MMNTRTANSQDIKRSFLLREKRVMYRLGFKKCPNCSCRQIFRQYNDNSLYCFECSWDSNRVQERQEYRDRPRTKTNMEPRLVKKAS